MTNVGAKPGPGLPLVLEVDELVLLPDDDALLLDDDDDVAPPSSVVAVADDLPSSALHAAIAPAIKSVVTTAGAFISIGRFASSMIGSWRGSQSR